MGGTTAGTAGSWVYTGPSWTEQPVGSARVSDIALAGAADLLASHVSTPRGIFHAAD